MPAASASGRVTARARAAASAAGGRVRREQARQRTIEIGVDAAGGEGVEGLGPSLQAPGRYPT